MKIMFINSVVDYGSTGKIVRDLANGLKDKGHDVLMVHGREDIKDISDTFSIHDKYATIYHVLMTRLFGAHGLHSKHATKKLIAKIKEYDPDIIHLHNIHGYYLHVPMLFKYLSGLDTKIYWTLHDAWSISGSSAYFDYHGCAHWDEGCVECVSTKDYPKASLFANQKRNFKWKKEAFTSLKDLTIVTPSDWLTNMVKTSFLKKYPAITINNGINLDVFNVKEAKESLYKDKYVILGVASVWETRKGLPFFIELADHLKQDEIIVLVGLEQKLINEMPSSILGIERTKDLDEMVDLYNRADVFLNPTLEDNFPTTNLEALACGTPVITFDTGGSPEAIDSMTGLVCEAKDVESIRQSLNRIRNSTKDYKKACRDRAETLYSKETMLANYFNLFEL